MQQQRSESQICSTRLCEAALENLSNRTNDNEAYVTPARLAGIVAIAAHSPNSAGVPDQPSSCGKR